MIFNARTWSFLCVRAYSHGSWAHRQRISTTFLTRQNKSQVVLVLLMGLEPRIIEILSPTLYQLNHPVIPQFGTYGTGISYYAFI